MAEIIVSIRQVWTSNVELEEQHVIWVWGPGHRWEIKLHPRHGHEIGRRLRWTPQARHRGDLPETEYLRKLRAGEHHY